MREAPRGSRPGGASILYAPDGARPRSSRAVRAGGTRLSHQARLRLGPRPWSAGISGKRLQRPPARSSGRWRRRSAQMWETRTTRNPMLLLRLSGWFLLR